MKSLPRPVSRLFDPKGRITALQYLRAGMALVALKYAGDVLLVGLTLHRLWRPSGYLGPFFAIRSLFLADAPDWLLWAMALWTIPFLFIGVSLSIRRLADSWHSPWWAMLFLVPYANYLLMAALCVLPTESDTERRVEMPPIVRGSATDAAVALAAAVAMTIPMVAFNTILLRRYSAGLFLGTPFSIGMVVAYFYNWKRLHTLRSTMMVVLGGSLVACLCLILVALEGAACILMAAPLALAIALPGAAIGRQMAIRGLEDIVSRGIAVLLFPIVPLMAAPQRPVLHEVRSSVEVDAPPELVWRRVIAFGDLDEPPSGIFRFGVAYPVRATISGSGAGAVRECVFSTGSFVEPITTWDAPRRLAFDVTSQPRPMTELSPWRVVDAPHLDGFLSSRRGEFRLIPLPGGRTRLEGSTWYTLAMEPGTYWQPFADAIIHQIHLRVLRHVRALSEGDMRGST
jgi:uncharacterized membrane protein YhaH (DUF805 family)